MAFDKKQYAKEYYQKNKEKIKERAKDNQVKNKEKRKKYMKQYQAKNKEQLNQYKEEWSKEYREKNKETLKQQRKEYSKTPQGKKVNKISKWKGRGLVSDNYDEIYERYISTTHCDLCKIELYDGGKTNTNTKCMEHDHITGEFRNIVCCNCNTNKSDREKSKSNTTGYKNISYNKRDKNWRYHKTFKGKTIHLTRKTKIEILCIKFAGIILFRY